MPSIHWLWNEFHRLSADELYQLMQFRQQQLIQFGALSTPDADGMDPLAWHLRGYHPEYELCVCARLRLPDISGEGITIDRLLCESQSDFSRELVTELLRFADECFKLPLQFEVFDAHLPLLREHGFEVVPGRAALQSNSVCMQSIDRVG